MQVLDHGYLELVEHWGSDERIIESARMSTGGGFRGWGPKCEHCGVVPARHHTGPCPSGSGHEFKTEDEKLLRYLYKHKHHTPFEMAGLTVEIKAPIMVFRQWHRRTQSYNEMSARYTPVPNEHYMPTIARLMMNGGKNKQAQGAGELTEGAARAFQHDLEHMYRIHDETYLYALAEGVPKELARLAMPVARYSKMRASANLRNWLGFLTLRMDSHAQWEIRQYADAIGELVSERFPRTWELFAGASVP